MLSSPVNSNEDLLGQLIGGGSQLLLGPQDEPATRRLVTLLHGDKELTRTLPDSFAELESMAREWAAPRSEVPLSLRVAATDTSPHGIDRVISGPYIYLTGEDSYNIARAGIVNDLRVEIIYTAIITWLAAIGSDITELNPAIQTFIQEVKNQTSESQARNAAAAFLADQNPDAFHCAAVMGFALRDKPALIRKLNKSMEKYDTQIVYPVSQDTDVINLFVVIDSSRGEIFAGPKESPRHLVRNTEDLRQLLSLSQEPWELLTLPSSEWASCVMELLQIEYRLFMNGTLSGEPFDVRYGRRCMRCMRRLANTYGVLPPSYMIHDITTEGRHAIWGGGYADIWRGFSGEDVVCLKVLRLFMTTQVRKDIIKGFCHEALVWKQLKHPNVLPFLGVSTEVFAPTPSFSLISPWMANGNLMEYLDKNPDHDTTVFVNEIAQGLEYLHTYDPPIVHGDIRGANILVFDDCRCCLADFGLSAAIETQTIVTSSAGLKGTVRWMAPELFTPSEFPGCGPAMRDIYAFGCTVLEIYSGHPPFYNEKHDVVVMGKVLAGQRPSPPPDKSVPDEIWSIVQLSWQHLPDLRPTATELLHRLDEVSGKESALSKANCTSATQVEDISDGLVHDPESLPFSDIEGDFDSAPQASIQPAYSYKLPQHVVTSTPLPGKRPLVLTTEMSERLRQGLLRHRELSRRDLFGPRRVRSNGALSNGWEPLPAIPNDVQPITEINGEGGEWGAGWRPSGPSWGAVQGTVQPSAEIHADWGIEGAGSGWGLSSPDSDVGDHQYASIPFRAEKRGSERTSEGRTTLSRRWSWADKYNHAEW